MIRRYLDNAPEAALVALVVAAFLLGGSARADISSVVLLRPIGVGLAILAIVWTPATVWQNNRAILGLALGWVGLAALHLVPLPPALWQSLPGRELATTIDASIGISQWRPLSLVPWRTLNSLLALCAPLAALLLTLTLRRERCLRLVYLLIILVVLSAALGLLQVIGGEGNIFYTYRITNAESAVGLFANRNHNAVFLALGMPLIAAAISLRAVAAEHVRLVEWGAAGAAMLLIPFILTTQSRAGIVIGLICVGLALWVYRSPAETSQSRRPRTQFDPRLAFGALVAVGLVLLTVVFSATNAIERLSRFGDADDELRLQIWPPIARLAWEYFPAGSGFGTFVEIYKTGEPAELLSSRYVNHAHNDWLEVMLTGGLPAIVLLGLAVAALVRHARKSLVAARADARDLVLKRLGVSICVVLALASIYDYPVRTPALAVLLAIGVAFACGAWTRAARPRD